MGQMEVRRGQNMAMQHVSALDLVKGRMRAMLKSVAGGDMAQRRFQQAAIGVAQTPSIMSCSPESVYKAIYQCARLNLIPDPTMHHVAIVPFKNRGGVREATVIIEYRGLVELARRACPEMYLKCGSVYANDEYELCEGITDEFRVTHRWWEAGHDDPGDLRFSYCISQQGAAQRPLVTIIPRQEALALARSSRTGYKPGSVWYDYFDRMAEKTALRRASRLWTLDPTRDDSRRFREAIEWDERSDALPDAVVTTDDDDGMAPEHAAMLAPGPHGADHAPGRAPETTNAKPSKAKTAKSSKSSKAKPSKAEAETEAETEAEANSESSKAEPEATEADANSGLFPPAPAAPTFMDKANLRVALSNTLKHAGITPTHKARSDLFTALWPKANLKTATSADYAEWIEQLDITDADVVRRAVGNEDTENQEMSDA